MLDADRTMNLDPDVLEIIHEAQQREQERGVKIELVCHRTVTKRSTEELIEAVVGQRA